MKNDDISCLVYPSVASNLKYANYGIKPSYIDSYFACKSIYMYKVEKIENEITLIPEKYAKRIIFDKHNPKNSMIEWKLNSAEDKLLIKKYGL